MTPLKDHLRPPEEGTPGDRASTASLGQCSDWSSGRIGISRTLLVEKQLHEIAQPRPRGRSSHTGRNGCRRPVVAGSSVVLLTMF